MRRRAIKLWVTPEEKERIAAAARACGLSMSRYARTLALGEPPPRRVDLAWFREVARMVGDLGRLGGLLRMFLSNRERVEDLGVGFARATIDNTLVDIRRSQDLLRRTLEESLRIRDRREEE